MNIKERIAEIDAFGRELANTINGHIESEELRGQSPGTIRRVEEIIAAVRVSVDTFEGDPAGTDFEFSIMRAGLAAAPFVTVARYTGRVGIGEPVQ